MKKTVTNFWEREIQHIWTGGSSCECENYDRSLLTFA